MAHDDNATFIGSVGVALLLIAFMPFVVLESTWAVVAMVALVRKSWGRPNR